MDREPSRRRRGAGLARRRLRAAVRRPRAPAESASDFACRRALEPKPAAGSPPCCSSAPACSKSRGLRRQERAESHWRPVPESIVPARGRRSERAPPPRRSKKVQFSCTIAGDARCRRNDRGARAGATSLWSPATLGAGGIEHGAEIGRGECAVGRYRWRRSDHRRPVELRCVCSRGLHSEAERPAPKSDSARYGSSAILPKAEVQDSA